MKIGIQELIVIVIVALIFIGPDKLPQYARTAGKWLRQLRNYTDTATKEVKEITEPLKEMTEPLKEITEPLNAIKKDITDSVNDVTKSIDNIGKAPSKAEQAKKAAAVEEEVVELEEIEQPAAQAVDAAAAIDAIGTPAAKDAAQPVAETKTEATV